MSKRIWNLDWVLKKHVEQVMDILDDQIEQAPLGCVVFYEIDSESGETRLQSYDIEGLKQGIDAGLIVVDMVIVAGKIYKAISFGIMGDDEEPSCMVAEYESGRREIKTWMALCNGDCDSFLSITADDACRISSRIDYDRIWNGKPSPMLQVEKAIRTAS